MSTGQEDETAQLSILYYCIPPTMAITRNLLFCLNDEINGEEEKRINYIEIKGGYDGKREYASVLIDTPNDEKTINRDTILELDMPLAFYIAKLYDVHIKRPSLLKKKIKLETDDFIFFDE